MKRNSLVLFICMIICTISLAQNLTEKSMAVEADFECSARCPELVHTTFVGSLGNGNGRDRTTIGVGEKVELELKGNKRFRCGMPLAEITEGEGTLIVVEGESLWTFVAPVYADTTKIRITLPSGNLCESECSVVSFEVEFIILEPEGINFVLASGVNSQILPNGETLITICGELVHKQNRPSSGFYANAYLYPTNVSFQNIQTQEGFAEKMIDGPYMDSVEAHTSNILVDHQPNMWQVAAGYNPDYGTLSSGTPDQVWFFGPCASFDNVPVNQSGTLSYNIPWYYRIDTGGGVYSTPYQFAIIPQIHHHDGTTLVFTTEKIIGQYGGFSSHHLEDPDDGCDFLPDCIE